MVTLTGPGGSGKSRLAVLATQALADRFVTTAFLAATEQTTPEQLEREISLALTGSDDADSLPSEALVTLDNLESVDSAAELVKSLAERGLTVLATSRLPLRLVAEREVGVPPLPIPPVGAEVEAIAANPAVQMFVDRARAVTSTFTPQWSAVGELVRAVDGLPLAIELAAACLRVRSVEEITASVGVDLSMLSSDRLDLPERQRTLTRTIRWSHEQLEPDARDLLDRLALFERSFTVEAMEALSPDLPDSLEALAALARARLIHRVEARTTTRFSVLGTVRAFSRQRLADRPDVVELQHRLTGWLLDCARKWRADLDGPQAMVALGLYDDHAADVDAAIRRSLNEDEELVASFLEVVADLWVNSGRLSDGRALAASASQSNPGMVSALVALALIAHHQTDWAESLRVTKSVLANPDAAPTATAVATGLRANALLMTGSPAEGADLARTALELSESADCYSARVRALSILAIGSAMTGDFEAEQGFLEQRLVVAGEHGDLTRTADTLNTLAEIALDSADAVSARAYAGQALEMVGDALPTIARDTLITLARTAALDGQTRLAGEFLRRSDSLIQTTGQSLARAQWLRATGALAQRVGEPDLAVRCFAGAQVLAPAPGGTDVPIEVDLATALAAARSALGEGPATRAWLLGRTVGVDLLRAAVATLLEKVERG